MDWAAFIPHGGSPFIQIIISILGFSQRIEQNLAKAYEFEFIFIILLLKQEAIQSRRQFKAGGNSKQEAIQSRRQFKAEGNSKQKAIDGSDS